MHSIGDEDKDANLERDIQVTFKPELLSEFLERELSGPLTGSWEILIVSIYRASPGAQW